ncbi:MAG: ABC transporter permease [Rhizobiaceae bacterium]|nr:ABC transporter permease [Rhizobiaceae bacterium]
MKKGGTWWAWLTFAIGATYFIVPLIATLEFSMRQRNSPTFSLFGQGYSFGVFDKVFGDERFQATFAYSTIAAAFTIVLGILIVVPTAYWIRLRMPHLRPLVEFITLLPLVIPAIVIVFGYIRMYGSNSYLPFLGTTGGTNVLLVIGYAVLSLPYMYRAVDTGLRTIDVPTLTEAAQILGAGWATIISRVILPNVLIAVLSGAFLTFAIVIGEFTMASLLNRPAFGPYMQNLGANRAYEPAALAIIAFALTWGCMAMIQFLSRFAPRSANRPN